MKTMFRKIGEVLLQILYANIGNEFYRDALENIGQHLGVVVDLGGGTGAVMQALIDEGKVLPQNSVVIDPHIGLHRIGVSKGIDVLRIVGVAEHLPIRDSIADAIIMHDALHHFENPAKGIEEACRIISREGKIYIYDYDLDSFNIKLLKIMEKLVGFPGNFLRINDLLSIILKSKCKGKIAKYSHGEFLAIAFKN